MSGIASGMGIFGCMTALPQRDCLDAGGTVVSSCEGFDDIDYDDIIRQACELYVSYGVYASVQQCLTDLSLGKRNALGKLSLIKAE